VFDAHSDECVQMLAKYVAEHRKYGEKISEKNDLRSSRVSRPRYTSPIPHPPNGVRISYDPGLLPPGRVFFSSYFSIAEVQLRRTVSGAELASSTLVAIRNLCRRH